MQVSNKEVIKLHRKIKNVNKIGRRFPVKRTHEKVIVFSAVNSKLFC